MFCHMELIKKRIAYNYGSCYVIGKLRRWVFTTTHIQYLNCDQMALLSHSF